MAVLILAPGCCDHAAPVYRPSTRPAAVGLPPAIPDTALHAAVDPPLGWLPDPVKVSSDHRHQVWISPGKATAYGVIAFHMPIPAGPSLALWGVLRNMQEVTGEATVIDRRDDPALPGIRFVVAAGKYLVRGNLTVDGFRGWVVYAGTLRAKPVNADELALAERAREATHTRLP